MRKEHLPEVRYSSLAELFSPFPRPRQDPEALRVVVDSNLSERQHRVNTVGPENE